MFGNWTIKQRTTFVHGINLVESRNSGRPRSSLNCEIPDVLCIATLNDKCELPEVRTSIPLISPDDVKPIGTMT